MPLPDRPVSGASIESVWGQEIHDDTFAPKGFSAHGGTAATVGGSYAGVHFDVADDDPGGWLDAPGDRAEVPTGLEGLYLFIIRFNTVNGTDGDLTLGAIYINGAIVTSASGSNDGGTNVPFPVVDLIELTAGDVIQFKARKRGSGSNPDVTIYSGKIIRIGREFGA